MKNLLVLVVLCAAGWFAYHKYSGGGGPPAPIENPVYGEMRASLTAQGREIEGAVFARMRDLQDCELRAQVVWGDAFKNCPGCTVQKPKCQQSLPPRYAKLFDDVPIPSTYLSATAGTADERDGRIVVYGLTDAEGAQVCEVMKTTIAARYKGTLHCVAASGK